MLPSACWASRRASAASAPGPWTGAIRPPPPRKRLEADQLAARADRGELFGRAGADEDQDRLRRRLFERLQQAVGPFGVEEIGVVDHGDLPPAHEGLQADVVAEPFLAAVVALAEEEFEGEEGLVGGLAHQVEVGMRAGQDHGAAWAGFAGVQGRFRRCWQSMAWASFRAKLRLPMPEGPAKRKLLASRCRSRARRKSATTASCPSMPCQERLVTIKVDMDRKSGERNERGCWYYPSLAVRVQRDGELRAGLSPAGG